MTRPNNIGDKILTPVILSHRYDMTGPKNPGIRFGSYSGESSMVMMQGSTVSRSGVFSSRPLHDEGKYGPLLSSLQRLIL